ncbi:DUF748 domain-containing protein [Lacimicrobium alkaliphilum]|uniref:AsmA domain-containing protein n=1 Tax=Lacimicrobium alkaliphilum TaxID=1526571 RepID=A0ABQ1RDM3_9ALTE|nr:hypothetical protein [Lacimicrobium alkaliphilum]GGD64961.1 hypothetical protein GCM10011357_20380 [Lacimicrobium alkaliphilum]
MKKLLIGMVIVIALIAAGVVYMASNLDELIRTQMETQGSKAFQTEVTVDSVAVALREGSITIAGFNVPNPQGYSDNSAFSLGEISLDLQVSTQEPYTVESLIVDKPTVLYEVDSAGKANLTVLKNNLQAMLPEQQQSTEETGPSPLVAVKNISIRDTRLIIDFESMDLQGLNIEELQLDKKRYEVTLPTFSSDPVGLPDGLPADQVGKAILDSMLSNLTRQAKQKAKEVLEAKAKEKLKEKVDEKTEELKEKAKDKIKDLFKKGS